MSIYFPSTPLLRFEIVMIQWKFMISEKPYTTILEAIAKAAKEKTPVLALYIYPSFCGAYSPSSSLPVALFFCFPPSSFQLWELSTN